MTTIEEQAVLTAISKKLIEAETRVLEAQRIFNFYTASRNEDKKDLEPLILNKEQPVRVELDECVE